MTAGILNRPAAFFLALLAVFAMSVFSPAHANSKYAAIVIHADTGDILFDKYSTQTRYPASLTKMMTLYLLFEELEAGRLTMETKLKVSRYAAGMPASKLGLKAGETITVEKAIEALVVKSANDVAVVVAEKLGRSEKNFAKKMTNKAWKMGMRSTRFRNASGLPNTKQITTARDMAVLSQRVVQDFPQYWYFFQKSSFVWKGKTYKSHNKLIGKFAGADGLKTGYTRRSGYNLATTVQRGDDRLIGIVLGGRSGKTRDAHMKKIIDQAYTDIIVKPTLISAIHRVKPTPSLKPTTLAELGGVWPPADYQVLASYQDAPTVGDSRALQMALARQAGGEEWLADNGLDGIDDMGTLISNMTDAEKLNTLALIESQTDPLIGEGDTDMENAVSADFAWSIQTGAYSDRTFAEQELAGTKLMISDILGDAMEEISEVISANKTVYRVRFKYLNEDQAERACGRVIQNGGDCFSMRDRGYIRQLNI